MITDTIQSDILKYLKEKNEPALQALRFILSQIQYAKIQKGSDLSDEDVQAVITKEVKKRKESIDMFTKAGRKELAEQEKKQLSYITPFLPQQMSEAEIRAHIQTVIETIGAVKNPGQVIGKVMADLKGKASGDIVSKIVKESLTS